MREPIRDVDYLVKYLRDAGETENNPILLDVADALEYEHDRRIANLTHIANLDNIMKFLWGVVRTLRHAFIKNRMYEAYKNMCQTADRVRDMEDDAYEKHD